MPEGPVCVVRIIARLNIGGPAIHVLHLSAKLDPTRYRTVLVAGREAPQEGNMYALAERLRVHPVFVETLGREISFAADLRTLWTLWRLLRRERPAIVHTHTAKAGTLGRLAALLAGVPIRIHTFHGHTFHGYWGPAKTRLFLAIERWLARHTTHIVGVSRCVCDDLLALGIGTPDTVLHIPLGLDLERFRGLSRLRGRLRAQLGVDSKAPLVGIVARLVPIKRHDLFLDAAVRVHAALPHVRFVLVGDGELRCELEHRVSELELDTVVHFAGWRDDLDVVYADLDLVALTSDNEGLPVALIEAMASGCPIVATDVGGVSELVTDGVNGFRVPPGDAEQLADRMIDVLSQPERLRPMGTAAQALAFARFGVERLIADIDGLYQELLKTANR